MKKRSILTLIIAVLALSCHKKKDNDSSKTAYSHQGVDATYGAPTSRLMLMDSSVKTSWKKLTVCIEKLEILSPEAALLETKISIVSWLLATDGVKVDEIYARFEFVQQDKCDDKDEALSYIVRATPRDGLTVFPKPTMVCKTTQESLDKTMTTCGTTSVNAHAGPGALKTAYRIGEPEKWVEVSSNGAGVVLLNGDVDWRGLEAEIKLLAATTSDPRMNALSQIHGFLQNPAQQTIDNLKGIVALLQNMAIVSVGDTAFAAAIALHQPDVSVGEEKTFRYRPSINALHTLLHEWGHVFGMDHPDQENPGSVYGRILATSQGVGPAKIAYDSKGLTKQAVMAYGVPYIYLTDDDLAGAKAVYGAISTATEQKIPSH